MSKLIVQIQEENCSFKNGKDHLWPQDNVVDIITKEARVEAQDSQQSLHSFEGRISPCWLINIIFFPAFSLYKTLFKNFFLKKLGHMVFLGPLPSCAPQCLQEFSLLPTALEAPFSPSWLHHFLFVDFLIRTIYFYFRNSALLQQLPHWKLCLWFLFFQFVFCITHTHTHTHSVFLKHRS